MEVEIVSTSLCPFKKTDEISGIYMGYSRYVAKILMGCWYYGPVLPTFFGDVTIWQFKIAIEHGHRNSVFFRNSKMTIFNSKPFNSQRVTFNGGFHGSTTTVSQGPRCRAAAPSRSPYCSTSWTSSSPHRPRAHGRPAIRPCSQSWGTDQGKVKAEKNILLCLWCLRCIQYACVVYIRRPLPPAGGGRQRSTYKQQGAKR